MLYKKSQCHHNKFVDNFLASISYYGHSGKVGFFQPHQSREFCIRYMYFESGFYQGKSAFFLHATGNDSLYPNLHLFQSMLNEGINIFTLDLPGHGSMSKGELSLKDLMGVTESAWKFYCDIEQAPDKTIIGVSLGAAIATGLAGSIEDRSIKVILVALPMTGLALGSGITELIMIPWHLLSYERRYYQSWYEVLPALFSFKRKDYPLRRKSNARFYLEEIFEIIKMINPMQRVNALSNRILYIGSKDDPIASFQEEMLENKHVTCLKIAGSNHLGMVFFSGLEKWVVYWCKH